MCGAWFSSDDYHYVIIETNRKVDATDIGVATSEATSSLFALFDVLFIMLPEIRGGEWGQTRAVVLW